MVYIDGFSHAKITQNNNKNVLMKFESQRMILEDYSNNKVEFKPGENLLWSEIHKEDMTKYNLMLLEFVNTPV